ncbi:coiled-coil domain-containing protein 166 [Gallus gallus]|uniref:Coiled-coil domain containing 166 n=1 Tax=Gallus gallus TaxID=9031 RepID=A0A3Q2UH76_CHICK|nr:coiled-coil domain-containing protein 166 [Gallus gallus]XP_423953.3 coiled-coil domain-containing protein 166 [Gallus gallus]|eukprot:XP_423953.3 coiled-coil domain-containing protein 166 [Gallus gallus]
MASKARQRKQDGVGAGKNKEVRTGNKEELKRIKSGDTSMEMPVRERNSYLQKEYEILTGHMNTYMGRVERFLQENKFLEEEAKRNRKESNIYLSYLAKHSQRCQNLIITLNEQNEANLSQVQKEKEQLISQYTEKEKEVRNCLVEVEAKYSLMNSEVEDLQPFKDLQVEQTKKIKELEKELLVTKIHHSEEMHKIKSRFLQAKADREEDSRQQILALTKRAEEAAIQSLIQHIKQVKAENRHLRQELLRLIQCSKVLKEMQVELREQQQQLLREKHCTQDMAHARHRLHQQEARRANQGACSSHGPFKRGY